jgi:hypothetical protein
LSLFPTSKKLYHDHPCRRFSPSGVVDQVWYLHLVDTISVIKMACQDELIHHDPRQGLHPLDPVSAAERAQRYKKMF